MDFLSLLPDATVYVIKLNQSSRYGSGCSNSVITQTPVYLIQVNSENVQNESGRAHGGTNTADGSIGGW